MTAVTENTALPKIAKLLIYRYIKRVPVVRDGPRRRNCECADLVRAVAAEA